MNNRRIWLRRRVAAGLLLIAAGLVLVVGLAVAAWANTGSSFDFRAIAGFGVGSPARASVSPSGTAWP